MRVLLVYPLFPKSFWSFEKTLELVGYKAQLPPLLAWSRLPRSCPKLGDLS
jgi:hypothetical protein